MSDTVERCLACEADGEQGDRLDRRLIRYALYRVDLGILGHEPCTSTLKIFRPLGSDRHCMRSGIIEQYLVASHGLASEAALHGSDRTLIFSETLPAHFRYYLVTTDVGGHWAAKKTKKVVD